MSGKPRMAGALAALEYFEVPDAEERAEPYAERKQEMVVELIKAGEFEAYPDALRFIMAVRGVGIPVAAASSSKNAGLFLQQIRLDTFAEQQGLSYDFLRPGLSLLEFFDADISGRDFAKGKPDPEIFLTAAQELGAPPDGLLRGRGRRVGDPGRQGGRDGRLGDRPRRRRGRAVGRPCGPRGHLAGRRRRAALGRRPTGGEGAVMTSSAPHGTDAGAGGPDQERATLTIGVDIGGTKVAAGVVDAEGAILETTRRDTPADDPVKTADVIADAVRELASTHDVTALGLGAAGFVNADRSTVMFAPNLAWRDEALRDAMEQRLELPTVVENDANAAAWAEARFGAGRGEDYVVVLTVGTGIGGGIVVEGQLLRGRFGVAAEIGHLNIVPDGRRCGCGLQGCWEQYASGRALVQEANEQAIASPALARELLRRAPAESRRASRGRWSRRPPRTATSRRCSASTRWADGWAGAWPSWRRSSTPACS